MARRKNKSQGNIPKTRPKVTIKPINITQRIYLEEIHDKDITFGVGPAGTGKTFLAAKVAMYYLTEGLVDRIVICRPAINACDERIGFLPGGINDKMDPFIRPIIDAFLTYWSKTTINDYLKEGIIEIAPLAFMRGRTFRNTFIIADEMQNASEEMLLMLLTRFGHDSKMVVTGDPVQSDVNGKSCFHVAQGLLQPIDSIGYVQFTEHDIVRHPTVKKILDAWSPQGAITAAA